MHIAVQQIKARKLRTWPSMSHPVVRAPRHRRGTIFHAGADICTSPRKPHWKDRQKHLSGTPGLLNDEGISAPARRTGKGRASIAVTLDVGGGTGTERRPSDEAKAKGGSIKKGLGTIGLNLDDATLARIEKLGGGAALESIAKLASSAQPIPSQPSKKKSRRATRHPRFADEVQVMPNVTDMKPAVEPEAETEAPKSTSLATSQTHIPHASNAGDMAIEMKTSPGAVSDAAKPKQNSAEVEQEQPLGDDLPQHVAGRRYGHNQEVMRTAASPNARNSCNVRNFSRDMRKAITRSADAEEGWCRRAGAARHKVQLDARQRKEQRITRIQRSVCGAMQQRLANIQKTQWRRWEQEFRKADPQRTGVVNTMQLRRILRQLVGSIGDGDFRRLVNAMQSHENDASEECCGNTPIIAAGRFHYRVPVPVDKEPSPAKPKTTAQPQQICELQEQREAERALRLALVSALNAKSDAGRERGPLARSAKLASEARSAREIFIAAATGKSQSKSGSAAELSSSSSSRHAKLEGIKTGLESLGVVITPRDLDLVLKAHSSTHHHTTSEFDVVRFADSFLGHPDKNCGNSESSKSNVQRGKDTCDSTTAKTTVTPPRDNDVWQERFDPASGHRYKFNERTQNIIDLSDSDRDGGGDVNDEAISANHSDVLATPTNSMPRGNRCEATAHDILQDIDAKTAALRHLQIVERISTHVSSDGQLRRMFLAMDQSKGTNNEIGAGRVRLADIKRGICSVVCKNNPSDAEAKVNKWIASHNLGTDNDSIDFTKFATLMQPNSAVKAAKSDNAATATDNHDTMVSVDPQQLALLQARPENASALQLPHERAAGASSKKCAQNVNAKSLPHIYAVDSSDGPPGKPQPQQQSKQSLQVQQPQQSQLQQQGPQSLQTHNKESTRAATTNIDLSLSNARPALARRVNNSSGMTSILADPPLVPRQFDRQEDKICTLGLGSARARRTCADSGTSSQPDFTATSTAGTGVVGRETTTTARKLFGESDAACAGLYPANSPGRVARRKTICVESAVSNASRRATIASIAVADQPNVPPPRVSGGMCRRNSNRNSNIFSNLQYPSTEPVHSKKVGLKTTPAQHSRRGTIMYHGKASIQLG